MKNTALKHFFALVCFLFLVSLSLHAQGLSEKQIDSLVEKARATFNVPGIAVAVIKDGEVIHLEGYGIRSIEEGGKVDENTLFGIASNTKAFTTAALAQLVDEGKIKWNTKVREIIPSFTLYNPYVSSAFTIRDLLTHRSGLGLGAGDLMIIPASVTTTKEELIYNLRFLEHVSPFRTKFDYDNLLYIVAGEVVERVSGMPYEAYVMKNIVQPLGMESTVMTHKKIEDNPNIIEGHVPVNGELKTVGLTISEASNAAGGMWSSVNDMSKWVLAQLN
ncbi:MAG TPA: serine hydrolase domain-containing protein, partial [Salinimicrobium sp.]|nr:serine hydrolase domain-containing protein [Salinimicrobium sp.]